jgi:hypothetical protein
MHSPLLQSWPCCWHWLGRSSLRSKKQRLINLQINLSGRSSRLLANLHLQLLLSMLLQIAHLRKSIRLHQLALTTQSTTIWQWLLVLVLALYCLDDFIVEDWWVDSSFAATTYTIPAMHLFVIWWILFTEDYFGSFACFEGRLGNWSCGLWDLVQVFFLALEVLRWQDHIIQVQLFRNFNCVFNNVDLLIQVFLHAFFLLLLND